MERNVGLSTKNCGLMLPPEEEVRKIEWRD
jgi:hypothetical protein